MRPDDVAFGQALAEGKVLLVKVDVVRRMPKSFKGAEVEYRVALRIDSGQNGRGYGDIDPVQLKKGPDCGLG